MPLWSNELPSSSRQMVAEKRDQSRTAGALAVNSQQPVQKNDENGAAFVVYYAGSAINFAA